MQSTSNKRNTIPTQSVSTLSNKKLRTKANATKITDRDEYEKEGLVRFLHGIVFQIKLLMLFTKRGATKKYFFRVASERKDAAKFDDIEFQYDDKDGRKIRFIQIKHKQNEEKRITAADLTNTGGGDFSLQKYFVSYRYIEEHLKPDETLKDLTIFTNVGFQDDELESNFEKVTDRDDILDISDERGELFRLKKDSNLRRELNGILEQTSDLKVLTHELVECYKKHKPINLSKSIFKIYNKPLARLVIDVKYQRFKLDTSNNGIPKYLYDSLIGFQGKPIDVSKTFGGSNDNAANDLPNDEITDTEIDDYFDKLIFAVDQPNETELFGIIEKAIEESESINLIDKNIEMNEVYKQLIEWMKETKGTYITYENCQEMLTKVKQQISKIALIGYKRLICQEIEESGIQFQDKLVPLQKFLESKTSQWFFLVTLDSPKLSSIRVHEAIVDAGVYQQDDSYIFVRYAMMKPPDYVLEAFASTQYSHLLVIEFSNSDDEMSDEVFQKFADILNANTDKKIIFIATEQSRKPQSIQWEGCTADKINLMDLTKDSQWKIYDRTQVSFQGHKVDMNKLLNDGLNHLLDEKFLLKIMEKEEIEIGEKLSEFHKVQEYYIDRKFRVTTPIFPLQLPSPEFCVIHDISDDSEGCVSNQDLVLISEDQTVFDQVCAKYPSKNVHWFTEVASKYVWQNSFGESISKLRKFLYFSDIENFSNLKGKVLLLSAPPGMGKTTELTKLANRLKASNPYLWVLRLNLVELSNKFNDQPSKFTNDITGKFLRETLWVNDQIGPKTSLEEALFDSYYEQGKVALYLDGFDEICPTYKKTVFKLLRILRASKLERLCVTTRPYGILSELEDVLLTFSHTFTELTHDEQVEIMTRIWKKQNLNLPYPIALREANKLINHFHLIGTEFNSPLHINLVATVCQEHVDPEVNFAMARKNMQKGELDLAVLYEKFFDKLFHEVYIQEKNPGLHQNKDRPKTAEDIRLEHEAAIVLHKQMALFTLFGKGGFKKLLPKEFDNLVSNMKEIDVGTYKMGLILKITRGKPCFVHKTFAEYFCALCVADAEHWEKFGFRNFFRDHVTKHPMVMQFFVHLLAKNEGYAQAFPIHLAVLQNDEAGLLQNVQNVETFQAKLNIKDALLEWSPMQYAVEFQHFSLVDILQKWGAEDGNVSGNSSDDEGPLYGHNQDSGVHIAIEDDRLEPVKRFFLTKTVGRELGMTLYHLAARKNAKKIVEYLISAGKFSADSQDDTANTALHIAAEANAMDVVEYLVAQPDVDVNFQNNQGFTPLHHAAYHNAVEVVKFLCQLETINVNLVDNDGRNALYQAAKTNSIKVVEHLCQLEKIDFTLEDEYGHTPLVSAAISDSLDVFKYLLEQNNFGTDLNCKCENSLLAHAAYNKSIKVVKYLTEQCSIDIHVTNSKGQTSLHQAALGNALAVVRYFIEKKHMKSNVKDKYGFTPLHQAARENAMEVVEYLTELDRKNIWAISGNGYLPLHQAAMNNALEAVKYFVEKCGVDITRQTVSNQTPLIMARHNGAVKVVQYLSSL